MARLALRSLLFAALLPGTVTVVIPYFMVSRGPATAFGHGPFYRYLGLLPVGVGAGILLRCVWDFVAVGRGTLAPVDPPKHLVVRGPYRYVRNPMYVGVVSILLGEALLFWSLTLLGYAGIFFTAVNVFIVIYEEPSLGRRFGESYEAYRRSVNRWLPRRPG